MLPSGVSFAIVLPTKIHPLKHHNKKLICMKCNAFWKDSISFLGICYLEDFIDTAHIICNFVRKTKLISLFSKKRLNISKIPKNYLLINNLSWYLSKWQSTWHSCDIELSKICSFQDSNTLRLLEVSTLNLWNPQEGSHHYPHERKSMFRPC